MNRHLRNCLLVVLSVWGGSAAAADRLVIDKVAAVVNEDVITLSEVQKEGRPLIQRIRQEVSEDVLASQMQITQRQILDALILRRLQLQEAKKEGVVVDRTQVTATVDRIKKENGFTSDAELADALVQENITLDEFKTKVWEQMVVENLLSVKVRTSVVLSEEEIAQYYQGHRTEYEQFPSVRIRHILVALPVSPSPQDLERARARANEALEALHKGTDFAEVAAQYSDGAVAREGGDLGVIRQGELDPALESVAFSLAPGKYSDIIRTEAGFNIIKVEERTAGDIPIAEVRAQMRERLFAEKVRQRMDEYFEELKEKAYIEIRLGE